MNGITEKPGLAAESPARSPAAKPLGEVGDSSRAFALFGIAAAALILCFGKPLLNLVRYALNESFYSHILLVPFISGYLIWTERAKLPRPNSASIPIAVLAAALGTGILGFCFLGVPLSPNDALTWTILPFCLFLTSIIFLLLGARFAKAIAFSLAFFFFITPFPEAFTNALEIGSQIASAEVYSWMLVLTGTPFLREGQEFRIPGLSLVVAQECSGIRSSFVLFLTSLLAGHMFLKSRWRRAFLAFFVIPLGIVRNGFRVLTLSLLTIHVDPRVIESPLHHRGGPIFFALSLIPFFLVLWWLRKNEGRSSVAPPQPAPNEFDP